MSSFSSSTDRTNRHPSDEDLDTLSRQLGRPVRDVVEIGARCRCGHPLVATTAPRLSNGIPFPTTYYLTHPTITAAVSRLEANGVMVEMTERLAQDPELAAAYRQAHESYLAVRDEIAERTGVGAVPEIDGISAGGMPERVKCLHVLVGHSLAAGPGVNPLGDEALEMIREWWTPEVCVCATAWDQEAEVPHQDRSRHRKTQGLGADAIEAKRAERALRRAQQRRVAGIDCGTNSIRLMIAEVNDDGGLTVLERRTTIVRLGQDVDKTGRFAPEALERTFAAVDDYAALLTDYGVASERTRFGATSAARDASNRQEFIDGILSRTGVEPQIISGGDEARLSFQGATLERRDGVKTLVIDLGGGSTEFVVGANGPDGVQLAGAVSTDMGSVRFTERYLSSERVRDGQAPSSSEIEAARTAILETLAEAEQAVPLGRVERVIGVAGTITTIFSKALGLSEYRSEAIHGAELRIDALREAAMSFVTATRQEKADMPFLHPGRVDVIAAGALIVDTILARLIEINPALTTISASETDILDGITLWAAEGS
jgi:exopolyphosphatase/guanosine-5'-triphosphate,3'-diphosphate pyrophosphatase